MCLYDFGSKFWNHSTLTLQSSRAFLASEAFMLRTSSFAPIPSFFAQDAIAETLTSDRTMTKRRSVCQPIGGFVPGELQFGERHK
jgi:hypothetical protein